MIKAEQDPPISQQVGAQSRQSARLRNENALFKRELTEELLRRDRLQFPRQNMVDERFIARAPDLRRRNAAVLDLQPTVKAVQ
jgi:hypothetical protein